VEFLNGRIVGAGLTMSSGIEGIDAIARRHKLFDLYSENRMIFSVPVNKNDPFAGTVFLIV
jgi:hypothetical protein